MRSQKAENSTFAILNQDKICQALTKKLKWH